MPSVREVGAEAAAQPVMKTDVPGGARLDGAIKGERSASKRRRASITTHLYLLPPSAGPPVNHGGIIPRNLGRIPGRSL